MLKGMPALSDPRILAGSHYSDDAAIFKINETTTIVQTLDFFPPVVDDPYSFGQISAANSLSDIYAMGGTPLTALNIVGFPPKLGYDILAQILKGGIDKANEAGVFILGGHSVKDNEVKYGLSVTGILTGKSFTPNRRAMPGDALVLTKPIGTGIIATGIKKGIVDEELEKRTVKYMSTLNKAASELMMKHDANSATDITGFGLLGHAHKMAEASKVSLEVESDKVPLISGVMDILNQGAYPGGSSTNRAYTESHISWDDNVEENMKKILADAQTSGGLLISIPKAKAGALLEELKSGPHPEARIVGRVVEKRDRTIYVK